MSFFGMVLTADGIKPDPRKVETIKKWPIPQNVTELQSFLGSVNYLSHFIPGLSQLRKPLQALIKKNSEYVWTDVHDNVFQDLKDMVSEDCLIQFYGPHKPLFIECDASKQGIGCMMLQPDDNIPADMNNGIPSNLQPVAYASKSLSKAEQNYANIERELLGVVFSLETFKHFTSGRQMNIITDHKPLTSLFSKCLANTSPRLARMMLHISDYDANVLYHKSSKMFLSDALSHLSSHNTRQGKQSEIKGLNISVHDVEMDVREATLDKIRIHSKTDSTLSLVMRYVLDGWPGNANECAEPAQSYFTYREELTIVDGLLVKGNRIVIPTDMRHYCLETLHAPHLGLQKTFLRARTSVFWQGMTADIKAQISNCSTCQKFQTKQPAETLRNELPTTQPWTCLATDIFEYGSKLYIIVVDHYSKFIVVRKVSDHSSEQTVATFLQIFSEFGVPDEIRSDRGANFTSQLFLSFCKGLDVKLSFSSAYHHSGNPAERAVHTIKSIMKKCAHTKTNWKLRLLEYLCTPLSEKLSSPAVSYLPIGTKGYNQPFVLDYCLTLPRVIITQSSLLLGRTVKKPIMTGQPMTCPSYQ